MKTLFKFSTAIILIAFILSSCDLMLTQGPNADYQIKGVVTDSISGSVLAGIRVVLECPDQTEKYDTIFTDSRGKYDFSFNQYPFDVPVFKLRIDDVDGQSNGEYVSRVIQFQILDSDWIDEGDDFDYYGKAVKVLDVKLLSK